MIYLYRQPKQSEQFVIGADPSEGGDYSAFVAISKFSADVVMAGRSKEESPQLGHTLNAVGKWFNEKTNVYPTIGVVAGCSLAMGFNQNLLPTGSGGVR